jgi:hypothetical protein
VTPAAAQRVLVLGAVALLAGVGIFAGQSIAQRATDENLPAAVPAPGGGWYEALAASAGTAFVDGPTDCGHLLRPWSLGVAHPVLRCDARLYIEFGDRKVLTQVLAHGPPAAGHDFELTPALARRLGLSGTRPIRWRYAR